MNSYRRLMGGDRKNRAAGDFYKTPSHSIEEFLDVEKPIARSWDPACGDGAFARVFKKRGYGIVSTDLYDRGFGRTGVDFSGTNKLPSGVDTIATNPPYKLGLKFAQHAIEDLRVRKLCLLMRLMWLESERRRGFFETQGLARVWVHSTRINVSRNGEDYGDGGKGGMVPFAWFVFIRGFKRTPTLGWLP